MGQRGPAPKSHALRVLEGTDKYETEGRLGDLVPPCIPSPPEWLGETELDVWHQLVDQLSDVPRLLSKLDRESMARYCCDCVEYVECRALIAVEGRTCSTDKGGEYQHPAVGIRNKCHDRMMRFEAKFGKTPADRARLEVGGDPLGRKGELEELLG